MAVLPGPPPCFYYEDCARRAEVEKGGKALCEWHAGLATGQEFPLRAPDAPPAYRRGTDLAYRLDMQEARMNRKENVKPPRWRTATTERLAELRAAWLAKHPEVRDADYIACPGCGRKFMPNHGGRRYCSDRCRFKSHYLRTRNRQPVPAGSSGTEASRIDPGPAASKAPPGDLIRSS